ncbi:unnamed protein product, partial [Didymodactylos carnosus]
EEHYLKEFYLTWMLYNKHLYEKLIYMDRKIQYSMSAIIDLLQPNEQDDYSPAEYTLLLNRFLAFDEEMSEIACLYKECEIKMNMKRKEELFQNVQQKKKQQQQQHQVEATMTNGNTCIKGKEKQQISKEIVTPLTINSGTKRKRQNTDPNKEKTVNEQTKQIELEKNGPLSNAIGKHSVDTKDDNSTDDTRSYTIDDLEDLDQGEEADEEDLDDEDQEDEMDEDEEEDLLEEECDEHDQGNKYVGKNMDWLQELNETKEFKEWIKKVKKNDEKKIQETLRIHNNKQRDENTKVLSEQAKFDLTLPMTTTSPITVISKDSDEKTTSISEKMLPTVSDLKVEDLTINSRSKKAKSKRKNKTSAPTTTISFASSTDTNKAKCDLLKSLPTPSIKPTLKFPCGTTCTTSSLTIPNFGLLTKEELILPPRTPLSLADLTAQFQSVSFTAGTFGSITNSSGSSSSSSSSTSSTCSSKKISATTSGSLTTTTTSQGATRLSINLTRKPTSTGNNSSSSSGSNNNSNRIAAIISELTGNGSGDEQIQSHKHESQVTHIRKKDAQFKKKQQSKHITTTTTTSISCGQMNQNGTCTQASLIVSGSTGSPSICCSSQLTAPNPSKENVSSSPSYYTEALDHLLRHAASSIEVSESALHSLLASLRSPQSVEQLTSSSCTTSSLPMTCPATTSSKQDQEKRSSCTSTPPAIQALIQQNKISATKETCKDDGNNNNNSQKHCDFCYCELLEHVSPNGASSIHLTGNGTVCASIGGSSSQRNAEIREKLRLRLTKRRVQASQADTALTTSTPSCCQALTTPVATKKMTDDTTSEQEQHLPLCIQKQKAQMKEMEKKTNVFAMTAQTTVSSTTRGKTNNLLVTPASQNKLKDNNVTNAPITKANTNVNAKQTVTAMKTAAATTTTSKNNQASTTKTSQGTSPTTLTTNSETIEVKKVINNNNIPPSTNSSSTLPKSNSETQTRISASTTTTKTIPSSATTTQMTPVNEIDELIRYINAEEKNDQSTATNASTGSAANSGDVKKSKKKKQQKAIGATTDEGRDEKLKTNKTTTNEQQIKIIDKPQANLTQTTSQQAQTSQQQKNCSTVVTALPTATPAKTNETSTDQPSTTTKKKRSKKQQQQQQSEPTATKLEESPKQSKIVNKTTQDEVIIDVIKPVSLTKKEQKKKKSVVIPEPQKSEIVNEDRSTPSPPVTTLPKQDAQIQQSSSMTEEHYSQPSQEEEVNWITISRKQKLPIQSTTTQKSTHYQSQYVHPNSNNTNTTTSKRQLNPNSNNKTSNSSKSSAITKSSSTTSTNTSSKLHTSNNHYQSTQKDQQQQQHYSATTQVNDSTYYNALRYMAAPPPPRLQNLLKNHASHQTRYQNQLSQNNQEDSSTETNYGDTSPSFHNSSWNEHEQQQVTQPISQVNSSQHVIRNQSASPSPSSNYIHVPLQQAPTGNISVASGQAPIIPSLLEEPSMIEQDPSYWMIINHQDVVQSQSQSQQQQPILYESSQQQYHPSSIDSNKVIQRPQVPLGPIHPPTSAPHSLYQQQLSQTQHTFSPAPGTPVPSQSSSSTTLINRCIQRPNSSASPNLSHHQQTLSPQPSSTSSYPLYSPMNYAQMNGDSQSPFRQWNDKQEQWKYRQQLQSSAQPSSPSYPLYDPFASGIQNPTVQYFDSQRYDQEQQQQYRRMMVKQGLIQENNMTDEDIFMPRVDATTDDMDVLDREIEEFKKFCLESKPLEQREKVAVNVDQCFIRQS